MRPGRGRLPKRAHAQLPSAACALRRAPQEDKARAAREEDARRDEEARKAKVVAASAAMIKRLHTKRFTQVGRARVRAAARARERQLCARAWRGSRCARQCGATREGGTHAHPESALPANTLFSPPAPLASDL